jgi:hypothetical protein
VATLSANAAEMLCMIRCSAATVRVCFVENAFSIRRRIKGCNQSVPVGAERCLSEKSLTELSRTPLMRSNFNVHKTKAVAKFLATPTLTNT